MKLVRLFGAALLITSTLVVGCSQTDRSERAKEPATSSSADKTPEERTGVETKAPQAAQPTDEGSASSRTSQTPSHTEVESIQSAGDTTAPMSDPAQFVQRILQRLSVGDAAALWDFLPPTYRQQLNAAIRQFGKKVDPVSWRACVELTGATASALHQHAAWVTNLPEARRALQSSNVSAEQFAQTCQVLAALAKQLLRSPWWEPDKLQRFDGRAFLQEVVTPLLLELLQSAPNQTPLAQLAQTRVELVSRDAQTAILQLTPPNQRAATYKFVLVDGQWIPASLMQQWPRWLAQLQNRLDRLSEVLSPANRPTVLETVERFRPTVARLAAAQSPAQFEAAWRELTQQLSNRFAERAGLPRPPRSQNRTHRNTPPVRLVIRGRLSKVQMQRVDAWLDRVVPDCELLTDFGTSATTILIENAPDPSELAKKIDFGRVSEVNEQERTIHVQPWVSGERTK